MAENILIIIGTIMIVVASGLAVFLGTSRITAPVVALGLLLGGWGSLVKSGFSDKGINEAIIILVMVSILVVVVFYYRLANKNSAISFERKLINKHKTKDEQQTD